MSKSVAQAIAVLVEARLNCIKHKNTEVADFNEERLLKIVKETMPSGSGIDNGVKIDLDKCTKNKLVFNFDYHHMNRNGYYDGWTDHTLTVTPEFNGFDMKISGRDKNQTKEYLYDLFSGVLGETFE